MKHLGSFEEGGGGNRISESQIKHFLDSTLGEAPRPEWGLPNGWGAYLAGEPHTSPAMSFFNVCLSYKGTRGKSAFVGTLNCKLWSFAVLYFSQVWIHTSKIRGFG